MRVGTIAHAPLHFVPGPDLPKPPGIQDEPVETIGVLFTVNGQLVAGGLYAPRIGSTLLTSAWALADVAKSLPEVLAVSDQLLVPAGTVAVVREALDRQATAARREVSLLQQRHQGALDGVMAQTRAIMGTKEG